MVELPGIEPATENHLIKTRRSSLTMAPTVNDASDRRRFEIAADGPSWASPITDADPASSP
jgi:hypothetical protein